MKMRLLFGLLLLGIIGCSAPIKQFYPDSYFLEDGVYQNRPLKFSLTLLGAWNVYTDPNYMVRSLKNLAREHQQEGRELLFVGTTADGRQGIRGVAINLNASTEEYAQLYRKIKTEDNSAVTADSGMVETLVNEVPMIRWSYTEYGHQFTEFLFTVDTYNIRIAFWSQPVVFQRFLPVYLSIMSSIEIISRY